MPGRFPTGRPSPTHGPNTVDCRTRSTAARVILVYPGGVGDEALSRFALAMSRVCAMASSGHAWTFYRIRGH